MSEDELKPEGTGNLIFGVVIIVVLLAMAVWMFVDVVSENQIALDAKTGTVICDNPSSLIGNYKFSYKGTPQVDDGFLIFNAVDPTDENNTGQIITNNACIVFPD